MNGLHASLPCMLHIVYALFMVRAEKFGAEYVEPAQRRELVLEAKKERFQREGFTTGIDLFSPVSLYTHCGALRCNRIMFFPCVCTCSVGSTLCEICTSNSIQLSVIYAPIFQSMQIHAPL